MKYSVKVLSKDQLDARYTWLANSNMAKLTKEAIEKGYSIALVEVEGLSRNDDHLTYDVHVALEQSVPRNSVIKVWGYTDMSQMNADKIYVAFKELKGQACAHAFDSDHCRISD